MAEWKKVIVSGSAAALSQVNVNTNQQITNSAATTYLSGSFSGSFQGNGAGLTGVTATAIFPTTAKTDLATSDQIYINDGVNKYITYGNFVTDLAGAGVGTSNLTTGDTGDSLSLTSQITVTGVTASLFGTASWATNAINATTATNATNTAVTDTTTGTGPYYITFADAASGNVAQRVDSTGLTYNATTNTITATSSFASQALSASFASTAPYSGLTGTPAGIVSASVLSSPSQGNALLTTNGAAGSTIGLGLTTSDSPTFVDLTLTGGDLIATTSTTFNLINSGQTTVNFAGAATTLNMGAATGTTTVNNNLSVLGTLYVQGSVTAISSSNLYVADQFILLASGSANNTDGGFVIDRGAYASGNIAYGFDSATGRWGYQNNVVDTSNTLDPTSGGNGLSGSFAGIVFTEAAHSATKPLTGEFVQAGAIYTNTDGTIWMYA
jgi:hypothetical protein